MSSIPTSFHYVLGRTKTRKRTSLSKGVAESHEKQDFQITSPLFLSPHDALVPGKGEKVLLSIERK